MSDTYFVKMSWGILIIATAVMFFAFGTMFGMYAATERILH